MVCSVYCHELDHVESPFARCIIIVKCWWEKYGKITGMTGITSRNIHWNDWNVLQFYLESISVIKQFDLQAQTSSVQEDMIAVFSLIDWDLHLSTATYTSFTWGSVLTFDLVDDVIVLLSNWNLQPHPILQILPSPRYKQSNHTSIYSK